MSGIPPNKGLDQENKSLTRTSLDRPGALRALFERVVLTWRLFWDGRVGVLPKLIPIAGLIYVVSPVDLLPALALGPLAPLGTLDDIGIVILAVNLFIQVSPPDVVREHLRELGAALSAYPEDEGDVIEGTAETKDE